MVVIKRSQEYLEHHGILKQKWGVRHGPPYPLNYEDHSPAQKKANPKSDLNNYENNNPKDKTVSDSSKNETKKSSAHTVSGQQKQSGGNSYRKGAHDLQTALGLTDEEAEKLKQRLKVAGIALGTTAAVVAAGYFYHNYTNTLSDGYNDDGSRIRYGLNNSLFNNQHNGDYIGDAARRGGYDSITSAQLAEAIANPNRTEVNEMNYEFLARRVRLAQLDGGGDRRLSCWSASNAYFMSAMTGHEYASKSFTNLVDFNDFGKLYNTKPQIYNLMGMKVSNFVGNFGKLGLRGGEKATDALSKSLVNNIFKNINENNNLSADGSRTIGFINGAYHSCTCTHQFNFEMVHGANGLKSLFIADGYSGDRYQVGTMDKSGKIKYIADGLSDLADELHHYNAESIRFYAPSVESINTYMMSNFIL